MLAYIALFLVLSFGLVVLCVWQFIAFGTLNPPYLSKGDLYFTSYQNVFLQVLNAIEFIWGIQFLRDACKHAYMQLTTSFPAILWSGTSTIIAIAAPSAEDPSRDSSPRTSEAWPAGPSSMPFSISSELCSISSE
jgi:hypothetical protein